MSLVTQPTTYIGRFAPSPTGPLHFGSLVAAVGSYLDAVATKGRWLLRIEDVDTLRSVPGMVECQINALVAYGFVWDGEVIHQSSRSAYYQAALEGLISAGRAYPCTCTRSQITGAPGVRFGVDGYVYPGTCAHWTPGDPVPEAAAWRFRVPQGVTGFKDRICGDQQQDLQHDVGDFPLRRADGCFTYQLAVVVDDLAQGVTDIVRGEDLLASTPRQIALIHALGGVTPTYAHLPVVKNGEGEKLSKQTRADSIPLVHEADRVAQLWQALVFLGQSPPLRFKTVDQSILWAWAEAHWNINLLTSA